MKDSSYWIRQPQVDKAADDVIAVRNCHPSEIKANWVAKKLGVELNGALSEKVFDWRRRRLSEMATLTIEVPPQAEANLREQIDALGHEAVQILRRTVRMVGSGIDQAATLRITDSERRADQAEADRDEVLVLCRQAEDKCIAMGTRIADLEQQLEQVRRANDRLLGRLEQRAHDASLRGPNPSKDTQPLSRPQPEAPMLAIAPVTGMSEETDIIQGGVEDDTIAAISEAGSLPLNVNANEQPSVIEIDHPCRDGQAEMPFDTRDNDRADADRGDSG